MSFDLDPQLLAAFGSATRLRTVAVLANAFRPLTGYRVGKTGGIALPKVYRELHRLERAGVVARRGKGWVLTDRELGALVAQRIRISWSEDWDAELRRRAPEIAALHENLGRIPRAKPPKRFVPRRPEEYDRPAFKDRRLREMGLRPSVHGQ
jgi:hypothetical protein